MAFLDENGLEELWSIIKTNIYQNAISKFVVEKITKSISENARETNYSYFTGSLNSNNSSISESLNTLIQTDYIYDTRFFTRELENFSCLAFLSDGNKIIPPQKIKLIPYFKKEDKYENF